MVAKLDGTPVTNGPTGKAYFCEACFPDSSDPYYLTCACRLCIERRKKSGGN